MKIRWHRLNLTLRHPFVTATNIRTAKQTIAVCVAHADVEGWGEAVPTDTYGQSLDSAERTLQVARALLEPLDPADPPSVVDRLLAEFPDQRATIAAIDAACHDWLGKRHGVPTLHLLGLRCDEPALTSVTLGIDTPEKMKAKMAEIAECPAWKIKIGTERETETLALIRRFEPHRLLRADANTGWSAADALDRLAGVARFNLQFVEQPCAADDLATLRRLREARLCPILADESCVIPADVPRVAEVVDGINIKLSKCGGIVEALRMIRAARERGLSIMLGCMIETSLGISAAAQLAPLVDWLDLDGHLLISDDPFTGLGGTAGLLTVGRTPGLGVVPIDRA